MPRRSSSLDVAARGAREQDVELGDVTARPAERRDEHVRALDQLRLEALAPADPVLLERPDDERVRGKPSAGTRGHAALGVDEREVLDVDPDRDP